METPPPRWVGRRCKLLLPPAEGLLPPLRVKEVKVATQRRGWKVAGGNRRGSIPGDREAAAGCQGAREARPGRALQCCAPLAPLIAGFELAFNQ